MSRKILMIDDEEDFCFFMKKNLEGAGDFTVETCSDALHAIFAAKDSKPDLILLDIIMPDKSGEDIAVELKEDPLTKKIPIIFLTAIITQDEAKKKGNIIGGEYFVSKPVQMDELLGMIETVLPKEG